MNLEDNAYFKKQRECLACGKHISEQRPVFLVGAPTGDILGPFHSYCAERLKVDAARRRELKALQKYRKLGEWPSIREETLPE